MTTLRKSILGVLCVIGVFAAGFFGRGLIGLAEVDLLTTVEAQGSYNRGSQTCSARSLQGSYGIKFEGQKIGTGPFVSVSRITFDGVGSFTTSEVTYVPAKSAVKVGAAEVAPVSVAVLLVGLEVSVQL